LAEGQEEVPANNTAEESDDCSITNVTYLVSSLTTCIYLTR